LEQSSTALDANNDVSNSTCALNNGTTLLRSLAFGDQVFPSLPPKHIILGQPMECYSELQFMKAGKVRDSWHLRDYYIEGNSIRSTFNRKYTSELAESPSHVVPTTMHIVAQHLGFIYLSEVFGFDHQHEERIKIWPTEFFHSMRNLIPNEKDLVVELKINILRHAKANQYYCEAIVTVDDQMPMTCKSIFLII
jgi:hypothetical protein